MTDYLTVDGARIAFTSAGSPANPPVLFLHGIMSHRGVWTSTMERLQQGYHCIAIDHLGFGDSDKPRDAEYSIARHAARALQVAGHFGLKKFSLVGHSLGGQIATFLTANVAPARVQKLVSVGGVVTGRLVDKVQSVTRRMISIGERMPFMYGVSRALVEWKPLGRIWFGPWFYEPRDLPYQSWKVDRRMAINPAIARSTPKTWDSLNATDLTPCLSDISASTLVLFGKQDGTVPVEEAYHFKKQLPAAKLVVLEECGHFPMYEKFEAYITTLEAFLQTP